MHAPRTSRAPFRRPILRLLALGLAVVLAAAACSSDDDVSEADVDEAVGEGQEAVEAVAGDDTLSEDEAEEAQESLSDAFQAAGLTSLASAIADVEISEISELTGSDEFTFFAPNDDAFASLTADELADLVSDPDRLAEVLRNHVVRERLDSATLMEQSTVETEEGNTLPVATDGETVTVGEATVVEPDRDVGNGVMHVVDALLVP